MLAMLAEELPWPSLPIRTPQHKPHVFELRNHFNFPDCHEVQLCSNISRADDPVLDRSLRIWCSQSTGKKNMEKNLGYRFYGEYIEIFMERLMEISMGITRYGSMYFVTVCYGNHDPLTSMIYYDLHKRTW